MEKHEPAESLILEVPETQTLRQDLFVETEKLEGMTHGNLCEDDLHSLSA